MTQYSRPIADLSLGNWTTSPLWSKLNEDPYNDSTEIVLNNSPSSACDIDLGTVTDPLKSTDHILRIRAHKTGSGTISCTAVLYSGATSIRSNALTLGTNYAETTITLTAGEADAITDYSALHVTLTGVANASGRYCYVSWIVLEVPDATTIYPEDASTAEYRGITAAEVFKPSGATTVAKYTGVGGASILKTQDTTTIQKYLGVGAVGVGVSGADTTIQKFLGETLANFLIIEETLYGE